MRICILGLGVIGTTYGYAFQKAGHQVEHLVREKKQEYLPSELDVTILDGRYNSHGEEKRDKYTAYPAKPSTSYDFIFLSVRSGKLKDALAALSRNNIRGTVVLFCNFWNDRQEIEKIMEGYKFIIGFPTAGGHMADGKLNCVLFDHIMLESEEKASIPNYRDLAELLASADIKTEIPSDMVEWIWIHMAINAGVTSTAAREGKMDNPKQLALNLMQDSHELSIAVKSIRETITVVQARGVNMRKYRGELLPYKIPPVIAGIIMKRMFANNELTRRIMTLHNDEKDIMYGCNSVYDSGKSMNLNLPLFYSHMDNIIKK